MQRALAAAFISKRKVIISNPGHSNDDKAAIGVIKTLGAEVVLTNDGDLEVDARSLSTSHLPLAIDCGESGLAIRMFTPIAAIFDREISITGSGSLMNRPMDLFYEVLPQLGIDIITIDGKPILT